MQPKTLEQIRLICSAFATAEENTGTNDVTSLLAQVSALVRRRQCENDEMQELLWDLLAGIRATGTAFHSLKLDMRAGVARSSNLIDVIISAVEPFCAIARENVRLRAANSVLYSCLAQKDVLEQQQRERVKLEAEMLRKQVERLAAFTPDIENNSLRSEVEEHTENVKKAFLIAEQTFATVERRAQSANAEALLTKAAFEQCERDFKYKTTEIQLATKFLRESVGFVSDWACLSEQQDEVMESQIQKLAKRVNSVEESVNQAFSSLKTDSAQLTAKLVDCETKTAESNEALAETRKEVLELREQLETRDGTISKLRATLRAQVKQTQKLQRSNTELGILLAKYKDAVVSASERSCLASNLLAVSKESE